MRLFKRELLSGVERDLVESVREGKPCSAFSLSFGEKTLLASCFYGHTVLYVTSDALSAKRAAEQLGMLTGGRAVQLPAKDDILLPQKSQSRDSLSRRMCALHALATGGAEIVTASIEALMQKFPRGADFAAHTLTLTDGGEYAPGAAVKLLAAAGYRREDIVTAPGQFAARGDILDIFPINLTAPVRIDFFGDSVESIRALDLSTNLSGMPLQSVTVCPCSDEFGDLPPQMGIEDFLPAYTVVIYDETKQIIDNAGAHAVEHGHRISALLSQSGGGKSRTGGAGGEFPELLTADRVFAGLSRFRLLAYHRITTANNIFQPEKVVSFRGLPPFRYQRDFQSLATDIKNWTYNGYRVVLFGRDDKVAQDISERLAEFELALSPSTLPETLKGAYLITNELEVGGIFHDSKLVLIATYEIIQRPKTVINRRSGKDVFTEARVGDYVVHNTHGIGRCEGITKLSGNFGTKDYVVVSYKGGDKLYVPVEQMSNLSRYSGSDRVPELNKIGGEDFNRLKERVKASVKKMAFDLLQLYKEREQSHGVRYSEDDELLHEFEKTFPYNETEDQLSAIRDILGDMHAGRIMDRLICGDVGYGKTEVALRAAFKTISEGGQVAFIAPTSILSEQHYKTCAARLSEFGIRVGCLNRFRTAKEQLGTMKGLADGSIDIVCGTHRVLSKEVTFRGLALLILDEEQRFGVSDKEKVKLLKKNINVLTLSATPIPRTLHMSLSGIRDISILETPPEGRVPVQTYVTGYSDALLVDAAGREIGRGGQVFIVFNRVEKIFQYAAEVAAVLPDARITVAHGQMGERELEDAIATFYAGESDILISTTIIENGIDLPKANTLIVCDADRLGLSQLYQLRGRVGRSNRLAYAYFTYDEEKLLTENAYKRLDAVLEYTEFGSGFKIAMRDLEIRGAGNILGAQQHGHMEKVGYDMYCKLLNQAVAELSGAPEVNLPDTRLETDLDAYIPEAYISDDAGRMRLYQRIGALNSLKDREKLIAEITDVYGAPSKYVMNLINSGMTRAFARKAGVSRAVMKRGGGSLEFDGMGRVTDKVGTALAAFKDACVLSMTGTPSVMFKPLKTAGVYETMFKFLLKCQ